MQMLVLLLGYCAASSLCCWHITDVSPIAAMPAHSLHAVSAAAQVRVRGACDRCHWADRAGHCCTMTPPHAIHTTHNAAGTHTSTYCHAPLYSRRASPGFLCSTQSCHLFVHVFVLYCMQAPLWLLAINHHTLQWSLQQWHCAILPLVCDRRSLSRPCIMKVSSCCILVVGQLRGCCIAQRIAVIGH